MILRLVKQLNPKVVVSADQGYNQNFIHLFHPLVVLLDSIDASGSGADIVNKIERFLIQPRIENAVLAQYRTAAKIAPWREIFASVGFVQGQFSNFTETQAECLLKRVQVRGFQVEKRQGSMFLYWQRGELGSVSAWKC
ncbi:uncharacterized protein A4U43_C04F35260 [Asparagus officinalis]|uniref:Uncharacterized protein n=2 Tax=Asparagus officinalis TaxID=4686 RepID=A0A5P1F8Q4_ASPOF|nr:uncharacterized protein A4U43_C04F35260 [Asparagus officinalis]